MKHWDELDRIEAMMDKEDRAWRRRHPASKEPKVSLEKFRKKNEQTVKDNYGPVMATMVGGGMGAGIGDAMAESKYKDALRLDPIHPKIVERRKAVNKMLKSMGRGKELVDESAYMFKEGLPVSKRIKYAGIGGAGGAALAYALYRLALGDKEK